MKIVKKSRKYPYKINPLLLGEIVGGSLLFSDVFKDDNVPYLDLYFEKDGNIQRFLIGIVLPIIKQ